MTIRRIWIEEGCISCVLCQDLVPEVFEVRAGETSRVRKKYERHLGQGPEMEERLQEAADSCPVEVIQLSKIDEQQKRGA
jgi:ferredoxin